MADEVREEDEWLYGENSKVEESDSSRNVISSNEDEIMREEEQEEKTVSKDQESAKDDDESGGNQPTRDGGDGESDEDEEDEEDSDDDDDDGVKVVIGDIKSTGTSPFGVTVVGVKRSAPVPDKNKSKFSLEDFETPGTINGVSALEFNIDGMEDKPWRKPGADITDYFNYGFNEDTWKAYSDRQKRMRFEAGGPQIINPQQQQDNRGVITVAFGQNQAHSGHGQRMDMMMNRRREEPRENTIQVMTADRREYSRKNFEMGMGPPGPLPPPFDMSIPPPNFPPPPGHPDFMPNPEYFNHPPPQYYPDEDQGYEEHEQWMDHHTETWDRGPSGPSSIVSLTKVPNVPPPPGDEETSLKEERK